MLRSGRTCYGPRIMAPTVICTGLVDPERLDKVLRSMEGADRIDLDDQDTVYRWLTQEAPFPGGRNQIATRLTQVFYRLYCRDNPGRSTDVD